MAHRKLLRIRLESVVNPGTEERGFHGAMPDLFSTRCPTPQHRALRLQAAFFHNLAVSRLYAKTDSFLVYVESDIVNSIHGVLLIEISESAASNSRSQQCNLEENPFSFRNNPFQHLYIQTDELTPMVLTWRADWNLRKQGRSKRPLPMQTARQKLGIRKRRKLPL